MMVASSLETLCACGCGRPVQGQRATRRYFNPSCRKRASRGLGSVPNVDFPGVAAPRGARHGKEVDPQHGGVTLSRSGAVSCAGCGAPQPKLQRPLPVASYCLVCAAAGRCPCYSRPAWHHRGRKS